jgi:uncharacterized protein (DUF1778 family)
MSDSLKYPLRMDKPDRQALDEAAKKTHASINQLILWCIRQALSKVATALTNGQAARPAPKADWNDLFDRPVRKVESVADAVRAADRA